MDASSPLPVRDRSRAALGPRQPEAASMPLYQEVAQCDLDALRESAGEATVRDGREDEDQC